MKVWKDNVPYFVAWQKRENENEGTNNNNYTITNDVLNKMCNLMNMGEN